MFDAPPPACRSPQNALVFSQRQATRLLERSQPRVSSRRRLQADVGTRGGRGDPLGGGTRPVGHILEATRRAAEEKSTPRKGDQDTRRDHAQDERGEDESGGVEGEGEGEVYAIGRF